MADMTLELLDEYERDRNAFAAHMNYDHQPSVDHGAPDEAVKAGWRHWYEADARYVALIALARKYLTPSPRLARTHSTLDCAPGKLCSWCVNYPNNRERQTTTESAV